MKNEQADTNKFDEDYISRRVHSSRTAYDCFPPVYLFVSLSNPFKEFDLLFSECQFIESLFYNYAYNFYYILTSNPIYPERNMFRI